MESWRLGGSFECDKRVALQPSACGSHLAVACGHKTMITLRRDPAISGLCQMLVNLPDAHEFLRLFRIKQPFLTG